MSREHIPIAEARAAVLAIRDPLGRPVDRGIMDALADFLSAGYSTVGSCQGHPDRALPYPWINFGYGMDHAEENARLGADIGTLLDEFYGTVAPPRATAWRSWTWVARLAAAPTGCTWWSPDAGRAI